MFIKAQSLECVDDVVTQPSIQPFILVKIRRKVEHCLEPWDNRDAKGTHGVPYANRLNLDVFVLIFACFYFLNNSQLTVLVRWIWNWTAYVRIAICSGTPPST